MGEGEHGRALLSAPARGGKACAPQEVDSELRAPEWGHQVVWGRGASGPELGLEGCVGHRLGDQGTRITEGGVA